jgi:hypothetical protein
MQMYIKYTMLSENHTVWQLCNIVTEVVYVHILHGA